MWLLVWTFFMVPEKGDMIFIQSGGKMSSMSESASFNTANIIRAGIARDGILNPISAHCIYACFTLRSAEITLKMSFKIQKCKVIRYFIRISHDNQVTIRHGHVMEKEIYIVHHHFRY